MAKSQIIKDIANGVLSLSGALNRALILAHDLKNNKLEKWIKNELYGYDDIQIIPEYRKLLGSLKISYGNSAHKVLNQPIGSTIFPDEYKDANIYRCRDSVSTLEQFASKEGNSTISLVEFIPFLKTKKDPYVSVFDFILEIPNSAFKRVIDSVSRELMEILLKIDDEVGNLDNLDIIATPEQQKEINKIINVHIDSFISVGDNNDISKTNIAGKKIDKFEK